MCGVRLRAAVSLTYTEHDRSSNSRGMRKHEVTHKDESSESDVNPSVRAADAIGSRVHGQYVIMERAGEKICRSALERFFG